MSQAEKTNITSRLTRRATLAGLSVAAAAGVAALPAVALGVERDPIDWPGILARAEHMITTLRRSYGGENWTVDDDEAAARTLRYFHAGAAGADDDEEWRATINFFGVHGQSLDWVLHGDPVTMICGMAEHSRQRAAMGAPSFGADAELIALGVQHDELVKQWGIGREKEMPWADRMNSLLSEVGAGTPFDLTPEVWEEIEAKVDELGEWPSGANDVTDAMDPISRRIMALPATTPAGLGVKARAAVFACSHHWDKLFDELNWDDKHARALIESVLQFAGDVSTVSTVPNLIAGVPS
jgi:hypothetical protein